MHSEAAAVLANFATATGKPLGLQLIKNRVLHGCFLVKFAKFLRTSILKNICERLLLCIDYFITF